MFGKCAACQKKRDLGVLGIGIWGLACGFEHFKAGLAGSVFRVRGAGPKPMIDLENPWAS